MDGLDHRQPGVKEFCLNVQKFVVIEKESKHLGINLARYRSLAEQDFRSFMHDESVEWKPLDDLSTSEECMHHWLRERVLNPLHIDKLTVQCWGSSYYFILENKYAAVLVYDNYDVETKIFCFK